MKHLRPACTVFVLLGVLAQMFSSPLATPVQAAMTTITESFDSLGPDWLLLGSSALNGGWLRLTTASSAQAGAAYYSAAFPTAGHVFSIEFDYVSYGGTGADGLAFLCSVAAQPPRRPGR